MDMTKKSILGILIIWGIYLIFLATMQLLGFEFGFHVFAMGEDRNWISFIFDSKGTKLIHKYWLFMDRNPLSPWLWWIVSPLIKWSDWSLYIIRKCADPLLAITIFLLIDKLGRQQCRTFAISIALLVLFWNFSPYYENFMWSFHITYALSLFSIFYYCKFVDNHRTTYFDYVLALLFYLLALSSYTLHSGAIIAVSLLSFFRKTNETPPLATRIKNSVKDIGGFLAIFIIYNCIWLTVSRNYHSYFTIHAKQFLYQLWMSIQAFIFPYFYKSLYILIPNDFTPVGIYLTLGIAFLSFVIIFKKLFQHRIVTNSIKIPLFWVSVVLLAISFPILMLEATNSTWVPGTRSLMVTQIWQPLIYVTMIFFVVNLLPIKNKCIVALFFVSILGSFTFLGGLDYNHRLVKRTHIQERLAIGLKAIPIPKDVSPYFLVRLKNPHDPDLNTIPCSILKYGQTLMHDDKVSLRVISPDYEPAQSPYWVVNFKADNIGVVNATTYTDMKPVPYKNLWIVFFDGKTVTVPNTLDKKDFEGLQITWERHTPIHQKDLHKTLGFVVN